MSNYRALLAAVIAAAIVAQSSVGYAIQPVIKGGDSNAGTANTGSADLCATAAQSINSLTAANYDFTITPTGLVAGQDLHVKMTLTVTDAATGTAVIGTVNHVELRPTVSR